jgi:hypothetical protein
MPLNVTFKIEETPEGEFVLYLNNHGQGLVTEEYCSKDLDEVVKVLKDKIDYRRHFDNAMDNYAPVMNHIDELCDKYPEVKDEEYPGDWEDPLELYGCLVQEMQVKGMDLDQERNALRKLMENHAPEWVWDNRRRLVAERLFIDEF